MESTAPTANPSALHRLRSLLVELEDLKRQQPAHYAQSIASTLFVESWQRLLAGEDAERVATTITTKAIVAVLLPGCDAHFVREAELEKSAVVEIYQKALRTSTRERLNNALYERLSASIPPLVNEYFAQTASEQLPEPDFQKQAWFVNVLCQQPRAGATKPGRPRMLLVPPEMHSDHCLTTAVFAVLLSPIFGASPGLPFLTGLSHHLHNAVLPDCGFGGEVLLDAWLGDIIARARSKALARLDPTLAQRVREAIGTHENLGLAAGRAASAADVLDRVLDVKWRTRAAQVKDKDILEELDLVHEGPIKRFQTEILNATNVWQRREA
ncbi:MAG: hypothetical protein WA960_11295 [Tunicatimonas sp.]